MRMEVIDVQTKEKKSQIAALGSMASAELPNGQSLPTDSRGPLRAGLWLLIIGFGGFLVWATTAPIDSGAASVGTVTLEGRRKTVQHLSGGVVKQILVREGQTVQEGAILLRMDDSIPIAAKSNAESQLKATDIQLRFLDKLLSELQPVADEGFYPKNRVLEIQKQHAEALAQRAALRDRVAAADLELKRVNILAPAAGRVMGLMVTTEGAVLQPGARVLDVVPNDERLVVEAQVMPHVIDRIVPGLVAEVRFTTTRARATPVILGTVEWVSADKFQNPQDPSGQMGYFVARIVVSAEELKKIPETQIRPGMVTDVIIKTGERTFMQYLIRPLTDSMARALKEH